MSKSRQKIATRYRWNIKKQLNRSSNQPDKSQKGHRSTLSPKLAKYKITSHALFCSRNIAVIFIKYCQNKNNTYDSLNIVLIQGQWKTAVFKSCRLLRSQGAINLPSQFWWETSINPTLNHRYRISVGEVDEKQCAHFLHQANRFKHPPARKKVP